jgi:hypothetical protein
MPGFPFASFSVDVLKGQPLVLHSMPSSTARNLVRRVCSWSRSASFLVLITEKGSSLAFDDDDAGVTPPPDADDDAMACSY